MIIKVLVTITVCAASVMVGSLVFSGSPDEQAVKPVEAKYVARAVNQSLTPANLFDVTAQRLKIDIGHATDRGQFGTTTNHVHLMTAPTSNGKTCFLNDSSVGTAASCMSGTDLFADHAVVYLVQSSGSPSVKGIDYLVVSGVASDDVDAVQIIYSSGKTHTVQLNALHSFVYRAPVAWVRDGDLPTKLVALTQGDQLASFPLNQ